MNEVMVFSAGVVGFIAGAGVTMVLMIAGLVWAAIKYQREKEAKK